MKVFFKNFIFIFMVIGFTSVKSEEEEDPQFLFKDCYKCKEECPNKNISFYLYTRNKQDEPTKLDVSKPETISEAEFSRDRPLIVIIHGFTADHDITPNSFLRPAFFKKDDFNIISVDYHKIAKAPCYLSAVKSLPTVANCTAQLLDHLIDNNIFKLDVIHIIGFSLGGQTAGMVANFLKTGRKLKRITGLDPAKPMFVTADNEFKLDPSDAEFVDVIHTDSFERGVLWPSGHVDFYPNGGFNQPGCYHQTEMLPGSCNHDRAPAYYAESINTNVGFWGFQCDHWYQYALGICMDGKNKTLAKMGYNVDLNARGLFFLGTNSKSPYARGKNFTQKQILPVPGKLEAFGD